MNLYVPEIPPDADLIKAALLYAKAGWFVLPINKATKMPALGKGWPSLTSNDTETIVNWFAGSDYQLGLHVGRSGAVALDVDEPDLLDPVMRSIMKPDVPFQSTRRDAPGRGHWIFLQPPGRLLGNSRGQFAAAKWGEVRGQNGIIVVEPSIHPKENGRYAWMTTGEVYTLPEEVASGLPDLVDDGGESVASNRQVATFIEEAVHSDRPSLLVAVGKAFTANLVKGSRHEALVDALCWGMREARAGYYPAQSVIDMLLPDFVAAMRGEAGRNPVAEFQGVLAFAVARAMAIDVDKRAAEVDARIAPTTRIPSQVRQQTAVQIQAPPLPTIVQPRPANDYFLKKDEGIDAKLLADDVMDMGELAYGRDKDFWSYENGVWKSAPKIVIGRCVWLLRGRYRNSHAANIETIVQHSVGEITCDPTRDYINFTNGMLNWRTGELLEHAPHFGSTVQLPVEYVPDAQAPVFDKFLGQILSESYRQFVWEMIGYMMMSGNPLQVAFMLLGTGSNGKGTLMRVINSLLGHENCSAISLNSLGQNRFAPSGLFGRLANIAGDIDATFQENTAMFKTLTGEDTINAERKFGEPFSFECWAVPMFSANKAPGSSDTSHGYLRRWKIIEFNHRFTEKDAIPNLSDDLSRELPGIAAQGVLALRRLMERNGGKGGFHEDEEIKAGKDRFTEAIDQVHQWVNDDCRMIPLHQEKLTNAYQAYRAWAINNGNKPLKSFEFANRLDAMEGEGLEIKTGKTNGNRWVRGLILGDNRLESPDQRLREGSI